MPELPDLEAYREALAARAVGTILERVRIESPFVLRTVEPPIAAVEGRFVGAVRRLGKRLVLCVEGELYLAIHLMVAGRLHWRERRSPLPRRHGLAAFDFSSGTLLLTEAGSKRRAALHLLHVDRALDGLDRGGIEVFEVDAAMFAAAVTRENHTLKRALTDPRLLAGVGNAYSDEILHRARLSPLRLSKTLSPDETVRLFEACRSVLAEWTARLRAEAGGKFPEKVTAFREGMAVHGRAGKPCPECGAAVQRIAYADNETNYCPTCQTGGRLLADRALSRLLRSDWPRSLDELEERKDGERRRLGRQPMPRPVPGEKS